MYFNGEWKKMAKATRVVEKTMKMMPVDEHFVDLRLSIEEAQFLMDVMYKIGGCPTNSRRKHADRIDRVLREVCPGRNWADRSDMMEDGNIWFKDSNG